MGQKHYNPKAEHDPKYWAWSHIDRRWVHVSELAVPADIEIIGVVPNLRIRQRK